MAPSLRLSAWNPQWYSIRRSVLRSSKCGVGACQVGGAQAEQGDQPLARGLQQGPRLLVRDVRKQRLERFDAQIYAALRAFTRRRHGRRLGSGAARQKP
jgi:hypothetical protein